MTEIYLRFVCAHYGLYGNALVVSSQARMERARLKIRARAGAKQKDLKSAAMPQDIDGALPPAEIEAALRLGDLNGRSWRIQVRLDPVRFVG